MLRSEVHDTTQGYPNKHLYSSGECTKLHPAWFYLTAETTFPVAPGDLITVKCPDGFINQGSETITCQNGIHYKFDNEPRCEVRGMKRHKIKPFKFQGTSASERNTLRYLTKKYNRNQE